MNERVVVPFESVPSFTLFFFVTSSSLDNLNQKGNEFVNEILLILSLPMFRTRGRIDVASRRKKVEKETIILFPHLLFTETNVTPLFLPFLFTLISSFSLSLSLPSCLSLFFMHLLFPHSNTSLNACTSHFSLSLSLSLSET